jgi:hypothetical protein
MLKSLRNLKKAAQNKKEISNEKHVKKIQGELKDKTVEKSTKTKQVAKIEKED